MATITFKIRGKKNPSSIYVRFLHTKDFDITVKTKLLANPAHWDSRKQEFRTSIEVVNGNKNNKILSALKHKIMDQFNEDYSSGQIIDKNWLQGVADSLFDRPEDEGRSKDHLIYFNVFAQWWMDNKADHWQVGPNEFLSSTSKMHYQRFIDMSNDAFGRKGLPFKNLEHKAVLKLIASLHEQNYRADTIKRHIGRFRFFCHRAEEEGIVFSKSYNARVFIPRSEPVLEPYFDEAEIERIYNHDFSYSDALDNARDNLIIAVWTGLRVSDFLGSLDISNFIDDLIVIQNQKTKTWTEIPVHPMVKKILIKRNGKLPKKISDQKFNGHLKKIAKAVGFTQKMKGKLRDKETKRVKIDMYHKYELISSHIGRRSFATNHFGKPGISNRDIMNICGWSSEKMLLNYVKKSKRESAMNVKKYWESKLN